MDAERADGIVLRCLPITESSLIVTWFTREFGKLKTIAKGARRPKSPFRGKIDVFYQDEIVFLRSKRGELHLLRECFLEQPHDPLRKSIECLIAASYLCELVELATEGEDRSPTVFELLTSTIDAIEQRCCPELIIWFELQLLGAIGWAPRQKLSTGVGKVLSSLNSAGLDGATRVRLSAAQLHSARGSVWGFWDQHVGKSPRSRKLLAGAKFGH